MMAKHTSNKLLKGLFALSAGFLLASCDPVHALPTNHAESIVTNGDGTSLNINDNDLLQIYNLVESGKNEQVVSQILRGIAEKKFGTYKEFVDAKTDSTEFRTKYAKYFGSDETVSKQRFEDFKEDIDERLSEAFYNEITSGSYNDQDGRFSEEKFYNSKLYDLYELPEASADVKANKFYITKDLNKYNVFEDGYLKGDYSNPGKRGYIEEKVYPEILKNKIVESYIYDNNPSSLGRAYARKINYIKVSYDGEFEKLSDMLKLYADTYIEKEAGLVDSEGKLDFELITSAVKGFTTFSEAQFVNDVTLDADDPVFKLLKGTYGAPDTDEDEGNAVEIADDIMYGTSTKLVPAGTYYKETKLGEILVSYKSACEAEAAGRWATDADKTELAKFTGEGKSKEYGLMQKLLSLAKEDYTTHGWFLKNGGATELPSAIRDRLFNIKVANILDDTKSYEGHTAKFVPETKDTLGSYRKDNYLRNINGNKLMIASGVPDYYGKNGDGVEQGRHYNYIYHDVEANAFYICQVLEAPSTAKFNTELLASVYKKADGTPDTVKIEQLSRQIAKVLGTKDSYIKDAYTDILEHYDFKFYDASLFEYLNSEYPDLDLDENDD